MRLTDRRTQTPAHVDSIPVRLVIWFVGISLFASLGIYFYLLWCKQPAGEVLVIVNGCLTGLLGLLGRTQSAPPQPPLGAPSNPATVVTDPDTPLDVQPVDEQPQDDGQAIAPKTTRKKTT